MRSTLLLAAALAACSSGGARRPDQSGPSGQPGPGPLDLAAAPDGEAGDGAAAPDLAAPPDLLPAPFQIACGALTCDKTKDEVCCFPTGGGTPSCTASCGGFFSVSLQCDGKEDCAGTKICCGYLDAKQSSSACAPSCAGALQPFCHANADCPAQAPRCCTRAGAVGFTCLRDPTADHLCLP